MEELPPVVLRAAGAVGEGESMLVSLLGRVSDSIGVINCLDVVVIPGVEGDGGRALLYPIIVLAPFSGMAGTAKEEEALFLLP